MTPAAAPGPRPLVVPARWRLDELAFAGPEHLDAGYVARYDAKARVDPVERVAALVRHGLTPDATLVDLGAATGEVAVAASRHCRRVVAVDVSPAMVAAARRRVAAAGAANVEVVRAGLVGYAHRGEPADVVHARHVLHQLPEFWKGVALARVARLLRPGGVLHLRDLVFAFDPDEAPGVLEAWLDSAPDDPARGWTADELAAHLRAEHSTYTWLLEPMLARTGFDIAERWVAPNRVFAEYVCVRRA